MNVERIISFLLVTVIACFWLAVAGAIAPKLLISDRSTYDSVEAHHAARYARDRVGTAGGSPQRLLTVETKVLNVRPDPSGCDWGYREPIAQIVAIQTYTLWGVPFEKFEVTCNTERRM